MAVAEHRSGVIRFQLNGVNLEQATALVLRRISVVVGVRLNNEGAMGPFDETSGAQMFAHHVMVVMLERRFSCIRWFAGSIGKVLRLRTPLDRWRNPGSSSSSTNRVRDGSVMEELMVLLLLFQLSLQLMLLLVVQMLVHQLLLMQMAFLLGALEHVQHVVQPFGVQFDVLVGQTFEKPIEFGVRPADQRLLLIVVVVVLFQWFLLREERERESHV